MRHAIAAAGAIAIALATGAVVAQELEAVTVRASRVEQERVGMTSSGVPIYEVSVSYRVSYADLDLKTVAGSAQLEERVEQAAVDACEQIDARYPKAKPKGEACVKATVDEAMLDVRKVIEAAR